MDVVGREVPPQRVLRAAGAALGARDVRRARPAQAADHRRPARERQYLGVVVIGTAQGDLHDIGKNLVAMMLEGAGFKVVNLGRDVSPEKFVAAVEEHGAHIVGISALMTTTMPAMKRTIDALTKAGLRDRVKVMVGGAPVSQAYADEIGADGYARDSTLGGGAGQGARSAWRRARDGPAAARLGGRRARARPASCSSSTAATARRCSPPAS